MAKHAAKDATVSIDAVALEDDIDNVSLSITPETPVVTALADAGPRRVLGNYDYGLDIGGKADFAGGQSDATLFNLVTDTGGGALAFDPTGQAAAADDPNYDATSMLLSAYSISAQLGGAVEYSASLVGNSALARSVA